MGPAGWVAAPAPGLFPLRPLSFGEILGSTFKLLRANAKVSIGSGLIIYALTTLLMLAGPLILAFWLSGRLASANDADGHTIALGIPFWAVLSMVPSLIIGLIGSALLQVIVAQVVAAAAVNRPLTFSQAWRRATKRMWAMIGYILLTGLVQFCVIAVTGGLGALLIFWIVSSTSPTDPNPALIALVIVFMFVLMLAMFAGLMFFQIKLLFGPSAIALENLGPGAALKRSWQLSKKYFWRTLGTVLLLGFIISMVSQVVGFFSSIFLPLLLPLFAPFGDTASGQEPVLTGVVIVVAFISMVMTALVSTLTLVLTSGNAVILYTDLRMRKEGLNIHLQRTAEQVAAGEPVDPEPWTAPDLGPAPDAPQPVYTAPPTGYPAPPHPGQPYADQPYPGQPYPGQSNPDQSYAGQSYVGQPIASPSGPAPLYEQPGSGQQPAPQSPYGQVTSPYAAPQTQTGSDTDAAVNEADKHQPGGSDTNGTGRTS